MFSKIMPEKLGIRAFPIACLRWIITAFVMLLLACGIVSASRLGSDCLAYLSSIISFCAACAAGSALGGNRGQGGILSGAVLGLFLLILLLLMGYLMKQSAMDPSSVLSVGSFTMAGCMAGSACFSRKRKRVNGRAGTSFRRRKRFP